MEHKPNAVVSGGFTCGKTLLQERDKRIAELEAELEASETELRIVKESQAECMAEVERLREAAEAHLKALEKWQYAGNPPTPRPEIAPTANALSAALAAKGEG